MEHSEKGSAGNTGGATIGRATGVNEAARIRGIYDASCVGPRELDRDAYVQARDRLQAEMGRFRTANALIGREMRKVSMVRLHRVAATLMSLIGLASVTPAMATLVEMRAAAKQAVIAAEERLASFQLEVKWSDAAVNLVTTVGKNHILDTELAGSSYSVVGPYMGLINTNASAAAVGDTMTSHAGWLEVGGANAPTYTAPRKTVAFSAASGGSKASSAASSFAITSSGTVGGCFLVLGSGALSTIDNTGGVLYSAGAFTGGSKIVANGDTLNVTYTASV